MSLLGWDRHFCEWQTHFTSFVTHWPELLSWPHGFLELVHKWLMESQLYTFSFQLSDILLGAWNQPLGSIYIKEFGKCPKLGVFFFFFQREVYQHSTNLTPPESTFRNLEWQMNRWGCYCFLCHRVQINPEIMSSKNVRHRLRVLKLE